jgi:hypothetical protein
MKKNILIKGILVLIAIALLTIGFTGCYPPSTGTVYVITDSWDDYDIYMDGVYLGHSYYTSSYFTIYNVPVGSHTFRADGWWWDGIRIQYIYSGTNYVTIYTY